MTLSKGRSLALKRQMRLGASMWEPTTGDCAVGDRTSQRRCGIDGHSIMWPVSQKVAIMLVLCLMKPRASGDEAVGVFKGDVQSKARMSHGRLVVGTRVLSCMHI